MTSQARIRPAAVAVLALALSAALAVVPISPADAASRSCTGLKNQTGITSKTIRIGNASDISGPVPNLYQSAQLATRAYVAYFNSTRRICGRRLVLNRYDTKTDAGSNRAAYLTMCAHTFAAVGSMSAFDSGGAAQTQACRLPDIRATASTPSRNACATCFGIDAGRANEAPNSVPDYFVAKRPAATQKAAMLYLNVGSVPARARTLQKTAEGRGYTFVYTRAIDIADFNYGPYVQQMKNLGVRSVQFLGANQQTVRLALAMQSAGFDPEIFLVGQGAYDPEYADLGGSAVNGSIVGINFLPLNANQKELNLYRTWLKKVAPRAKPTPAGLFAWSAAKLFTTQATRLGGRLNRTTLNKRLRTVNRWTGGGLHAPMQVGTRHRSPCTRLLYLANGRWISIGGTGYRCTSVTTAR